MPFAKSPPYFAALGHLPGSWLGTFPMGRSDVLQIHGMSQNRRKHPFWFHLVWVSMREPAEMSSPGLRQGRSCSFAYQNHLFGCLAGRAAVSAFTKAFSVPWAAKL